MCNFNKQNDKTKALLHLLMKKSAQSIGGVNFLLGLCEALRATKPHPLTTNKCEISSEHVQIKWNKTVFKDKLELLEAIVLEHKSSEDPEFNILASDNAKKKKRLLNMLKTLAPIEFKVIPKDPQEGEGFTFKVFDHIEDERATLHPLFVSLFFCSVNFTKQALKYEIQEEL